MAECAEHRSVSSDQRGWWQEGRDLLRAIAAGSIVGIPLLYTMEMWWHGMVMSEWHLLLLLAAILVINFFFNLLSGFRERFSVVEAASGSVTSVAMGLLFSCGVLWLIGEITFERAWGEIVGRALIEAGPVSLGISFANYQVGNKSREGDEDQNHRPPAQRADANRLQLRQDLLDFSATVSGATIFAYNIAPTEEIIKIASRLPAWQHLVLMAASMGLCYMILFAAGFQERHVHVPSLFQSPLAETTMAYAVSLLVAFGLLYLVGVPETMSHVSVAAKATVTLGLPAVVGASAGRLIT